MTSCPPPSSSSQSSMTMFTPFGVGLERPPAESLEPTGPTLVLPGPFTLRPPPAHPLLADLDAVGGRVVVELVTLLQGRPGVPDHRVAAPEGVVRPLALPTRGEVAGQDHHGASRSESHSPEA